MASFTVSMRNTWPDICNDNPLDSITAIQNINTKMDSFDNKKLTDLIAILTIYLSEKNNESNVKKALLEVAYRTYYKALIMADAKDADILPKFETIDDTVQNYIIYGVMLTDYHKVVEYDRLVKCVNQLVNRITTANSRSILLALRCVNLLYSKYPSPVVDFSLTKFYFCLQSQSSAVRNECFLFFKNWLSAKDNFREVFSLITNYWPWTNKYKYFLLSVLLSNYKLENLVNNDDDIQRFLQGIRLSLRYKSLFSSGQLVFKALSKQNFKDFDLFLIDIIKTGTHEELVYFNSQWAYNIPNKDELFIQLEMDQPLENILAYDYIANDSFRFVIICTIFQKMFAKHPQSEMIVDYIQQNCFHFSSDTQLYIYKFVIESILTSSLETTQSKLNFILQFIRQNFVLPCSEYRNTILNKFPIVFDYLAKKFTKPSNKPVLVEFFGGLKQIFKDGISRSEYQPLIFNLKLFEILLKCFESSSHKSLLKNSNLSLHQKLGKMIMAENIWQYQNEYMSIFNLLLHSGEFDDVRDLIVKILIKLHNCKKFNTNEDFDEWKRLSMHSDIDKCMLISFYTRLLVHRNCNSSKFLQDFYEYCHKQITNNIEELETDSLSACTQGRHIFGLFNTLNELFKNRTSSENISHSARKDAIELANEAVKFVLEQLNLAGDGTDNAPPSFQVIEESLEMLVLKSSLESKLHSADRKFLLLSFWMTLKACCELATTIGILFVETSETDDESWTLLNQCLALHVTILYGCRHKGAIEAAGNSIGKLIKVISSSHSKKSRSYQLLYDCFSVLFGSVNNISTTRRGAGLSILLQHLIKNDSQKHRPLFQHAIKILLRYTNDSKSVNCKPEESDQQHDNFEALVLHYLCVLVRDSELKDSVSEHYDEIMMSAIYRINEQEWTIRNAALQLFGALVPKIVGQKQAADVQESMHWEPFDITFTEFCLKLPKTCTHILESCRKASDHRNSISSIILFLEFLSNIEYLKKCDIDDHLDIILEYRELFWRFLSHQFEKVRKLASKCLARFHDFHTELPKFLNNSIGLVFHVENENFVHGLVLFFIQAIYKLQSESQFISNDYLKEFQRIFAESYQHKHLSSYIKSYFIDLFKLVGFDFESKEVREILCLSGKYEIPCKANSNMAQGDLKRSTSFGIYILEDKIKELYDN